jgi:hypothetical protein
MNSACFKVAFYLTASVANDDAALRKIRVNSVIIFIRPPELIENMNF